MEMPHLPAGRLPAPGPDYLPSVAERRRVERIVAERLLDELGDASSTEVLRTVVDSARELRTHGVTHGLEPALEAMARSRLAASAVAS